MSEIDHPIHQQFSEDELRAIVEEAGRAERGTIYVPTRFIVDQLLQMKASLPRYAYEKG